VRLKYVVGGVMLAGLLTSPGVRANEAVFEMSYSGDEVKVGEQVNIDISLSADESTLGADLVLQYDESKLQLVKLIPSEMYPNVSSVEVDTMRDGKVHFSGVSEISEPVLPDGDLLKVKFRALSEGETEIKIIYDDESTTATGVVPYEGVEDSMQIKVGDSVWLMIEKLNIWEKIVSWLKRAF